MAQKRTLEIVERTMSVISIIGCLIIIISFLTVKSLRVKTFNRLLFLASFGNVLTNIATFISLSGPAAGNKSAICKTQATLIQWFMPADCLWTFCMAVNVFLAFQTRVKVKLQDLEKWYFFGCYVIPGIPALFYLISDAAFGTSYYGNATLWCWISKQYDKLRLFTFYAPVWIVIIVTMALYAITGRNMLKKPALNKGIQKDMSDGSTDNSDYVAVSPGGLMRKNTEISRCTEISQTTEIVTPEGSFDVESSPSTPGSHTRTSSITSDTKLAPPIIAPQPSKPLPRNIPIRVPVFNDGLTSPSFSSISDSKSGGRMNKVTTTVTFDRNATYTPTPLHPHVETTKLNTGARTYAKVAFMLYLVMLVVWVPSTVNRVYGLVNPNKVNFGLYFAAAFVLPLQGFFNSIIYLFTSRTEIKKMWHRLHTRKPREDDMLTEVVQAPASPWKASEKNNRPMTMEEMLLERAEAEGPAPPVNKFPWRLHRTLSDNSLPPRSAGTESFKFN